MTKIENLTIDSIWMGSSTLYPKGIIVLDWSANIGFGEYVLKIGEDGVLYAYTEYMDRQEDKKFTKMIFDALADKIKIVD